MKNTGTKLESLRHQIFRTLDQAECRKAAGFLLTVPTVCFPKQTRDGDYAC